ncbi:hypothetical protein PAQ31011_01203 [Pandoraea aquatica]|uniref:Uncharacterized protein n=1 Tax=Pandoraea aquatica TaxID=2508290 RepID=A0A5E4T7D8_9BURK|nr:hypothetical protein [Pandoraea aquatica]VVD82893.1 hypothetical protein PAQ31011_01203 [Pandoraea aquatica]
MPMVEGVDTNAAALAAQVLSQSDTPESSPHGNPTMANDLSCVTNCGGHSALLEHQENGHIRLLISTHSPGIPQLAVSIRTCPQTIDEGEPDKKIDETKEGEESGEVEDSPAALEDAKTVLKAAIDNRYHDGRTSKLPTSFWTLSKAGQQKVFASAMDWVLSNSSERTPKWFSAILDLAADEGLAGYLTKTVQQHTYDKLDNLVENRLVKSVIDAYGMRI